MTTNLSKCCGAITLPSTIHSGYCCSSCGKVVELVKKPEDIYPKFSMEMKVTPPPDRLLTESFKQAGFSDWNSVPTERDFVAFAAGEKAGRKQVIDWIERFSESVETNPQEFSVFPEKTWLKQRQDWLK